MFVVELMSVLTNWPVIFRCGVPLLRMVEVEAEHTSERFCADIRQSRKISCAGVAAFRVAGFDAKRHCRQSKRNRCDDPHRIAGSSAEGRPAHCCSGSLGSDNSGAAVRR